MSHTSDTSFARTSTNKIDPQIESLLNHKVSEIVRGTLERVTKEGDDLIAFHEAPERLLLERVLERLQEQLGY